MAGRNDPRKRKPGKGKAVNPFKAVKEGLGQMGANYRAAGRAITPKSRTPEDVKEGKTSSKTTASSGRKKAPNYSTSPAVSSVGTMPAHRTKAGTRTTVKGGPGVTKKPKAKNSAAPTTKAKAPAPSKAKKAAASPKSRSRSSGSSVKLLSPAEARKVREKRMSDAVAAGRKKRAASGSPPKAMRGKQIRTAAMPRKKKRKGRTSYDELMS